MNKINIKLYGIFRMLGSNDIQIEVSEQFSILDLKKSLLNLIQNKQVPISWAIINASAIAVNDEVINEFDMIDHQMEFSILPPVNGG